ncbi:PID-CTERM protein-sorting domain-containing protein [Gracilimonas mengyeensis]|uniref:Uncharacterized protein n=1 Tax=Gracilimonas mengyeensis TaxID=1302730 RepID=A0A521DNT4_9BACT|nr:hypothetical protein [Gracilimonas mengyeensis]SMO73397.1 hypothetical protein SAMN06265219_10922 [Gracilimonas mengyeensis]
MKTTIYIVLSFVFSLLLIQLLMAQPPGLPQTPSQAPIDGGLALLAAAGGGYALKKLRDRKKMDDNIDM